MSRVAAGAVCAIALTVMSACGGDDELSRATGASVVLDGSVPLDAAANPNGDLVNVGDGAVVPDTLVGNKLDLLFMIDNSGSMASKQARLLAQVPRMLSVLTTGDRCAQLPAGETCTFSAAERYFAPIVSMHIGVVSTNMGGLDNPPTQQAAIASCAGNGDDGILQHDLTIALNGVIAQSYAEFPNFQKGDVVLAPDPTCGTFGAPPAYQTYSTAANNFDSAEHQFMCVAKLGVRGCPFEQSLEAPWKALAKSTGVGPEYVFLNGTVGQGDRANAGFLRDDALLGIVLLTDEDDCSITDAGKVLMLPPGEPGYDDANVEYGPLNLRCGLNYLNPALMQPTSRYVDGFRSLKPGHPERVFMLAVTGVPQAAVQAGMTPAAILQLPEMQFAENPAMPGYPVTSCVSSDETEVAYPPVRITSVVDGLGAQGVLHSICEDSYRPGVESFVEKIAAQLGGVAN